MRRYKASLRFSHGYLGHDRQSDASHHLLLIERRYKVEEDASDFLTATTLIILIFTVALWAHILGVVQ